jgi:hypothetical protein
VTDIRARLADAIAEALESNPSVDLTVPFARGRIGLRTADVLLSLPGIAIVELPDRLPGYTEGEMPRWETAEIVVQTDHHDWVRLNSEALEPWEARALAVRLLAAAEVAEQK